LTIATFVAYRKQTNMLQRKLLVIAFSVFVLNASAQFSKGERMVSASVGSVFYNSGKTVYTYPAPTTGVTSNNNNFGINVNPVYGWFITDHIVVGPSLLISYNHNKTFFTDDGNGNTYNSDVTNTFNIGLGAFARDYFPTSGSLHPYGQFGFNLGIGSLNSEGFFFTGSNKSMYDGKSSGNFFANAGLALGLTKMVGTHTGLDFSLGYNFSYSKSEFKKTTRVDIGNNGSVDQTDVSDPTQKFTNHGVALSVGFQVFLEKKKK